MHRQNRHSPRASCKRENNRNRASKEPNGHPGLDSGAQIDGMTHGPTVSFPNVPETVRKPEKESC